MIVERCSLDELEQLRVDRRPDRAPGGGRASSPSPSPTRSPPPAAVPMPPDGRVGDVVGVRLAHVLHRHVDLQVERLAHAGVDDRALAPGAHEEAADLLERALGRRQADALQRAARRAARAARASARGARRAWCAPRRGSRRRSPTRRRTRNSRALRGQHQVERLGRGDQHVRRLAQHRLALLLRRVAGADRHRRRRRRCPCSGARRFFSTS